MVPESPRYLYSKKDWLKLHKSLSTIAKFNGIDIFKDDKSIPTNIQDQQLLNTEDITTAIETNRETEDYSIMEALRDRKTIANLIAVIS